MTIKTFLANLLRALIVCGICLLSDSAFSQCAGTAGAATVCEKYEDEANKTYDLFLLLNGTPTPGGRWATNDAANFFALNRNTGILNLWNVKNSGIHEFTYTNNCAGATESTVVTIRLGGYPGEENIDGTAAACGDDTEVNLFGYIGDDVVGKSQDFNGIWATSTPGASMHLNDNIFNAETAGPGTYEFTHTVPAVDTCPSRQVRLILQVQKAAKSGVGSDETICATDNLSTFTNYDLHNLLADEDANGTWSESAKTNQLSDLTDRNIDIQAIRDNHGPGLYPFTYTVFPEFAVCEKNETEVNILILPTLRGTMQAANYCNGPDMYTIDITTYETTLIEPGTYPLTYSIASGGEPRSVPIELTLRGNGTGVFDVPAEFIPLNQEITITLTSLGIEVCEDIQVPPVSFIVTDPNASITGACVGEAISVSLSNIYDASYALASGNYNVDYMLTGPSAASSSFTETDVAFTNGNGTFTIPATAAMESGAYSITIEVASGLPLDCELTAGTTVTAIPSEIELDLTVDDSCNATKIDITVDAPILNNGTYNITYDITQQGTGIVVSTNTINFNGGTASYAPADMASLEQGNYTVSVRSTQDDTTPCRTLFDFEEKENFAIEGVPALPEAEAQQNFCLSAFRPNFPTLADIAVAASGQIMFYATATDMDILSLDTPLVTEEDYFISNIDPNNNCEGSDRIRVKVVLENPDRPIATGTNPVFCDSESPIILDLNASVDGTMNIVWFDSAIGGTPLNENLPLTDGTSYFAASETQGRCTSIRRLEIVPTVYALGPVSLQFAQLALCGLDNPTVANLRVTEDNNPYEVLWYDSSENGSPLTEEVLLNNETTYYAESFNPETGCTNPARVAVTVDLSDCAPEEYGFFIPDGFSPNADGRNDTFFIPDIETIFPNFTLEILNRYGSRLFLGDINNPAWNGEKAANGVYFYIINYNKEGHEPIQGRLYLNR